MLPTLLAELPPWLETVATDLGTLWPIVLFVGAAYGLVRWISKKFKEEVHELIVDEIQPIKAEFKNNGGSSFKDAIDRLENGYLDLKGDLVSISTSHEIEQKYIRQSMDSMSLKHDEIWRELKKQRESQRRFMSTHNLTIEEI
jgi:hypothetical protein